MTERNPHFTISFSINNKDVHDLERIINYSKRKNKRWRRIDILRTGIRKYLENIKE